MAATRTEREQWQADLDAILAADTKSTSSRLRKAYAAILSKLKVDLADYIDRYEALSFSKRLEVERLFKTALELSGELAGEYSTVGENILAHAVKAGEQGYLGVWYALEQVEELQITSMGLDRRFIESIAGKPVAGATLSERLYRDRMKLAKTATQAITQGIVEGRGYRAIARTITDATEASYRNAVRITVTEAGRVRSVATQQAYKDATKTGLDMSKRWVATLDGRTRHDHRFLDGQTVPYDGKFTVEGHTGDGPGLFGVAALDIWCRCTTEPIIDGFGASHRRDNTTGDDIEYQTYREWSSQRTS